VQYPGVVFNRDYLYGMLFGQLLNENQPPQPPLAYYDNSINWINPTYTRTAIMSTGQGGPYQINNYPGRQSWFDPTTSPPSGIGIANYTVLQQGLGYTVEQQDCGCQALALAPDSLDSKYFAPLAAAYYSFSDISASKQGQSPNSPFNTCLMNLNQTNIAAQSANNILDIVLSTIYNSGISDTNQTSIVESICAAISPSPSQKQLAALQALADYSLSPTLYSAATGISTSVLTQKFDYARDIRLSLDQLYNAQTLPAGLGNTSVSLSVQDISTVFTNALGTLSYVNSAGKYGYIASVDSENAFKAALTTTGLTLGSSLLISKGTADRAKFFDLLDAAILNLEKSLINSNFTGFNAITQTTFPGMPVSSPQTNPPLTK